MPSASLPKMAVPKWIGGFGAYGEGFASREEARNWLYVEPWIMQKSQAVERWRSDLVQKHGCPIELRSVSISIMAHRWDYVQYRPTFYASAWRYV